MQRKTSRDLLVIFLSLFFIYNANLQFMLSGDSAPARLLPFSLLLEGDLDLDEFGLLQDSPLPPGPSTLRDLPRAPWKSDHNKREGWLMVSNRATGQLRLFARSEEGAVWENRYEAKRWSEWRRMRGEVLPGRSRPTATMDHQGNVHLFVQTDNEILWQNTEENGVWKGWQPVPGTARFPLAPVAMLTKDGAIRLIARDAKQRFLENYFAATTWQGWRELTFEQQNIGPADVVNIVGTPEGMWFLTSEAEISPFALRYFARQINGHIWSLYPVVVPVVVSPLYLPAAWFLQTRGLNFVNPATKSQALGAALIMEKFSASIIACFSALFVYLVLLELGERKTALWLTLLYGLGTSTWTISSQALWQHGLSALSLSLLVYALLKLRQSQVMWPVLAGCAAALTTANRPPNLIFSMLAFVYVYRYHRGVLGRFLWPPLFISGLLLVYNLSSFGSLTGGYSDVLPTTTILSALASSDFEGLLGLLVSPNRGLFLYTSFAVFSFWGGVWLWTRDTSPLLKYMSLGVAAQILFYGKYQMWWGGWCFGPRFLTDISPFLCFFLVPILPLIQRGLLRGFFVTTVVFSVAVQMTGAFCYSSLEWDASPITVDAQPERLWDWHDTQLWRSLQSGPQMKKWFLPR